MGAGTIGLKAIFSAEDRGVTSTIARMQAGVIGFTHSAGESLAKLDAFNSKIAGGLKTAAVALGGVGLGAAVVAKNVVDAGADFEQAITNVGAVSLMTREQVAPLEKLAISLGASTKFSATEVANAMERMGKAGFDNGQIMEGVGGILSAAAADGAELADTASNISNVLKGMGLETSQTARVADVLTLASARTNSSISSLGESMANVSSTARQLGVPLEDTVAMVALLQDVGLDASEAGSATATMLTRLSAPSKEAAAQMAAMGVKFQDAAGNMLAPAKVLGQLVKAGEKAGGNMKQVAFFAELTGMRGQKAALNLKDLFKSGKVTSLVDELKGAAGSAEKMSGIRMDTFKGDIETLGGSVDSLKIKLFDMQNGPLRAIAKGTTEWIDANSDLIASGLNDFIKEAIPLLDNFKDGILSAGENALPVLRGVGSALETVFGNGSKSKRQEAFMWGETIAKWGIRWLAFSAALKVARGGLFLIENATKATKVVTWMWDLGKSTKAAVDAFRIAQQVGPSSLLAMSNALNGVSSGAVALQNSATGVNAIFDTWASKAGLAAIAIGAIALAYDQASKLAAESGGAEGMGEDTAGGVAGFFGSGTESWGVNGFLEGYAKTDEDRKNVAALRASGPYVAPAWTDKSAANAADELTGFRRGYGSSAPAARPPGPYANGYVSPAGMAPPAPAVPPSLARPAPTAEEFHAMVAQELTVKVQAADGTTAEVTQKPKGAKVILQPSGSF